MGRTPYLLVVKRGERSETHVFSQDRVSIGRSRENDLRLDDRLVSRRHCRIERREDGYLLVDEGAQNKVRVRGEPVQQCALRPGESFRIGAFEVTLLEPAETESADDTLTGEPPRSTRDLEAFVRIARALNEERNLTRLLTLIVDSAIQLTQAERGFLILGEGDDSTIEVARNFAQEEVLSPEFKISRTIARRVLETGVPEVTTNAQEDARFRDSGSVADLRLRSILCLPIRIRGAVEGVLYVDNRLQQQVFGEREKEILLSLADHAGIAIHNARTMEELRASKVELESALARVAQLNAALEGRLAEQRAEIKEIRKALVPPRRGHRYDYSEIVGDSRRMREVFALLDKYVESEDPVLVLGESGTGKELVARAIWSQGRRSGGPFVSENVAALPQSLLESELFGYVRGAFTGATQSRRGLLQSAHGGVLFLDEIGEMPLELQAKLLRVLEEGEVRPLGGTETVSVDVRLITATNRNLEEMVREGDFREDLYYRLNVLPVHLPPLRERREDVPALVERFLLEIFREEGKRVRVSPDAMDALMDYSWPGNVRELQNEIRRAALLSDGVILCEHLREEVRHPRPVSSDEGPVPAERGASLPDLVAQLEIAEITKCFRKAGGNKSRAAQMLGLSRFALQRKLDKYGIALPGAEDVAGAES